VNETPDGTRRGFLLTMGRYSLALLVGGGVGLLSLGRGECTDQGLCRQCALFEGCELPVAVSLRQSAEARRGWTDATETAEDDAKGVPA
jgi:hypothetical protein